MTRSSDCGSYATKSHGGDVTTPLYLVEPGWRTRLPPPPKKVDPRKHVTLWLRPANRPSRKSSLSTAIEDQIDRFCHERPLNDQLGNSKEHILRSRHLAAVATSGISLLRHLLTCVSPDGLRLLEFQYSEKPANKCCYNSR